MKMVTLDELLTDDLMTVDKIYNIVLQDDIIIEDEKKNIIDVVMVSTPENDMDLNFIKREIYLSAEFINNSGVAHTYEDSLLYKDFIYPTVLIWLSQRQIYLIINIISVYSFKQLIVIVQIQNILNIFSYELQEIYFFMSGLGVPP